MLTDSCRSTKTYAREMELNAAFLKECEEVSFVNVGGSLRAKYVASHHIPHYTVQLVINLS